MSKARAAITNHPEAQEAADECLKAGGSALDAVLAAFFAFSGSVSWGLLAPVTVVVAGSGAGVRFIDGRGRQPGQGIERPVRYNDEASVPLMARASAPATAAAISLAASMFGRESLAKLAPFGARAARKLKARARASMITHFGSAKSLALQNKDFLAEIGERVPRFEGALLQPADLVIEGADVVACEPSLSLGAASAALPPWHDPARLAPGRLVALASERGSLAGLILEQPAQVIPLFEGELDLPALAAPMLKGIPRLRAGAPLPMAAPLAALFQDGRPVLVAGATSAPSLDEAELASLVEHGTASLSIHSRSMLAVHRGE